MANADEQTGEQKTWADACKDLELRISRIERILRESLNRLPDNSDSIRALKDLDDVRAIGELTNNCHPCVRVCDLVVDDDWDYGGTEKGWFQTK